MNWNQALDQMKLGNRVRRQSAKRRIQISDDVYEEGEEAIMLTDAITDDGKQVRVLQGCCSKELFYPRPCQVNAVDWVCETA